MHQTTTTRGLAALLTTYTWAELVERYQALREAEARRAAVVATVEGR